MTMPRALLISTLVVLAVNVIPELVLVWILGGALVLALACIAAMFLRYPR
jgi:hypothetical protein